MKLKGRRLVRSAPFLLRTRARQRRMLKSASLIAELTLASHAAAFGSVNSAAELS
jgi:hypothetical protein